MNTLLELTFTVAMPSLAAALLLGAIVLHFGIKSMHADRPDPAFAPPSPSYVFGDLWPDGDGEYAPESTSEPTSERELAPAATPSADHAPLVIGNGFAITPKGRVYATQ